MTLTKEHNTGQILQNAKDQQNGECVKKKTNRGRARERTYPYGIQPQSRLAPSATRRGTPATSTKCAAPTPDPDSPVRSVAPRNGAARGRGNAPPVTGALSGGHPSCGAYGLLRW